MKLKASIIIPTYNSALVIEKCLQSIFSCTQNLDYEIIIVDNDSQDATKEIIKKFAAIHPQTRLLERAENLGYGCALNFGSTNANGEFLVFMNPDVILKNNVIYLILKKIESGNYILAAPILLDAAGKRQISVWANFPSPINLLFEYSMFNGFLKKLGIKRLPFYIYDYGPKPRKAPRVLSGAMWLIKKQDFEALGGFDKKFFLYYEDTDFCRRLYTQNSDALILVDAAEAIHLEGKSSDAALEIVLYNSFWSMFYYLKKYYSHWQVLIFKIFIWCISLVNVLILSLVRIFTRLGPNLARRCNEYSYFLKNNKKFSI